MVTLTSAAVVALIALLAPLAVQLTGLRAPEVVVQILLGIVFGPQLLGWSHPDAAVGVLSVIGLAFLLLEAGMEIDFDRLRGRFLHLTSAAFVLSFALSAIVGLLPAARGLVGSPLLLTAAATHRHSTHDDPPTRGCTFATGRVVASRRPGPTWAAQMVDAAMRSGCVLVRPSHREGNLGGVTGVTM